ncbi:MAG TPA: carboxypeptidase regulatory-like domain-containing protein [Coriobacteriia bacterium]|nr:carboxypeptidase regulatory-like domain-containing protein [Coriobacteriia bacterium]
MSLGRRCQSDAGFTVVEALAASAILLIIALGVTQVFAFASLSTRSNSMREHATELANQRIEQARNIPYDSLGVVGGDPGGTLADEETDGDYTVSTDVTWARDPNTSRATYKHVEVAVGWSEPTESQVRVSTNVFGQSDLVNTGDVVLTVIEKLSGDGLPDVAVRLTPSSGSSRTVMTDENGEAFFGFVPTGEVTFNVAPSGYIVDLNTIAGAVVTNDTLTRLTLVAERGASLTGKVRTTSGTALVGSTLTLTQTGTSRVYYATTGADGNARFTNLFSGDYTLRAAKAGYTSATIAFAVAEASDTEQTVTLAEPQPLSVRVNDSNGVKMPGATVVVTNQSTGASMSAVTADSGVATFNIVDSANYTIAASKTGYSARSTSAYVTPAGAYVTIALPAVSPGTIQVYNSKNSSNTFRVYRLTPTPAGWAAAAVAVSRRSYYTFTNISPGTYRVYVNPGSTPSGTNYMSATITDGDNVQVTW